MLQMHGRAYHRIFDAYRGSYTERTPVNNKARMYIYDAVMQQQASAMKGKDMDNVNFLATSLKNDNSWVSQYKTILLELNDANNPEDNIIGIEFAQVSRQTHGNVIGDSPPSNGKEIAALIFKDDPNNRPQRAYTFPRSGPGGDNQRPRFVPLWSPTYEPLQYPLLLYNGDDAGWSPGHHTENLKKKSRTLSTTGKVVTIWYYARQRLLCEKVFQTLSSVAQENGPPAICIRGRKKTYYLL